MKRLTGLRAPQQVRINDLEIAYGLKKMIAHSRIGFCRLVE
jgi:hypothetical protein